MTDCLYLGDNKYNSLTPEKYIKSVLDKCEVVDYAKATFDGDARYKQRTATIIEWLNITELEQRSLKAVVGSTEKYKRITHKRRKAGIKPIAEHLNERKSNAINNATQAKELRAQGLSIAKIQEKLGVSRVTVHKYLKGTV
jgi:hypothetical protein